MGMISVITSFVFTYRPIHASVARHVHMFLALSKGRVPPPSSCRSHFVENTSINNHRWLNGRRTVATEIVRFASCIARSSVKNSCVLPSLRSCR